MAGDITRHGFQGGVTIALGHGVPANFLRCFQWELTAASDVYDDSDFQSTTRGKTKSMGMYDGKGTMRVRADRADHPTLMNLAATHPVAASFVLREGYITTSTTEASFTFDGFITSFRVAVIKTDVVFYDVNFESSGEITPSTA